MTRKISDGQKCDSCYRVVDILIPIRVLCEANSGFEMQLRHYCPECFDEIIHGWNYKDKDGEVEKRKEGFLKFKHEKERDIWHFQIPRHFTITGETLRELMSNVTGKEEKVISWVIAWYESDNKVGYQIITSREDAEEIYEKIKAGKKTEEIVFGAVIKRDLLVEKEEGEDGVR